MTQLGQRPERPANCICHTAGLRFVFRAPIRLGPVKFFHILKRFVRIRLPFAGQTQGNEDNRSQNTDRCVHNKNELYHQRTRSASWRLVQDEFIVS
jgi:hypothetical protein